MSARWDFNYCLPAATSLNGVQAPPTIRRASTPYVTSLDTGFILSIFIKPCQLQKQAESFFLVYFAQ